MIRRVKENKYLCQTFLYHNISKYFERKWKKVRQCNISLHYNNKNKAGYTLKTQGAQDAARTAKDSKAKHCVIVIHFLYRN